MIRPTRAAIARLSALGIVAGTLAHPASAQAQVKQQAAPKSAARSLGVDSIAFDRAVRPQDDFFRFVNGGWLKSAVIPSDASRWGAFDQLSENSRNAMHAILEAAAKNKNATGDEKKLGDLYATYMDSAAIDAKGIEGLRPELDLIAKIGSNKELPQAFAKLIRVGVGGPVSVGVGADQKNSTRNIVGMGQSGLGLPEREYYLSQTPQMQAIRTAYAKYITTTLELAKYPDAAGAAQRIIALETAIAQKHWDRVKNRDRNATYNKMSLAEAAKLMPNYDLPAALETAGLKGVTEVVVRQPDYLPAADSLVANAPVQAWKDYLTLRLLGSYTSDLPSAFNNARFEFSKMMSGQQVQSARWKRAVGYADGIMGEAAGKIYVAQNFKPEAKRRMDEMVKNLVEAYRIGIDSLEWMSPETKKEAKAKLAKFTVKIAYPDQWRDYSKLEVVRGDQLGNSKRARAFGYDYAIAQLNKPVDKARWGMTPQTVNAYYNPSNNEIVFPAAILQPPFFDVNADDAVNYGGIGAVIGHEIGHGFDDQGRKSDGEGNLRDWWTAADAKAFEARTTKLGAQFDALEPLPGLHVNGKTTMGENIGDLSGLAQAYRAYKLSLKGKEAPVIGGFTGDQRFFLGFAQIWRSSQRDEALRQQVMTDPHSPGMYRAFVPLVNNDVFMKAWDVKPGDKMWREPADRVKIW